MAAEGRKTETAAPHSSAAKKKLRLSQKAQRVSVSCASARGSAMEDTQELTQVRLRYRAKRTRVMKLRTVANRRVLSTLAAKTKFSAMELKMLAEMFTDASDVCSSTHVSHTASLTATLLWCADHRPHPIPGV